ncbi:hypothetical protein [Ollibium composti]|uniref:Phage portal protein n=1 Tax=Ollibium composti TaxID=2675109 RepID=A0ABY2Q9L9_9HYPH|nr:hypothetical protein [Mesorhizobium composti]THF58463.1 hypothetical protein E6C48_07645 [Mesorhizobium composti]
MTRFARTLLAALIGAVAPLSIAPPIHAADLPAYVDEGDTGVCSEPWVLNRITSRFRYQVQHVPHLPDVEIVDFRRIHQHRYLPALGEKRPIARRYCGAKVALSDGRERAVWYLVEEGQGYAGMGDNVEFCMSGFDRWMVYNGHCRVLR